MVWEKIFKCFLLWLPWQTEFLMEHNSLKEFKKGPPREHSCVEKIQSIVPQKTVFVRRVYRCTDGRTEGRTHNGHNAISIARWPLASGAKNHQL